MRPKTANEVLALMEEIEKNHSVIFWWKSMRRILEQQQAAEEQVDYVIGHGIKCYACGRYR